MTHLRTVRRKSTKFPPIKGKNSIFSVPPSDVVSVVVSDTLIKVKSDDVKDDSDIGHGSACELTGFGTVIMSTGKCRLHWVESR